MKNKILLLGLISIISFTSCSDDDDSDGAGGSTNLTTAQKLAHPWTVDKTDVIVTNLVLSDTITDTTTYETDISYDFLANGDLNYKYQGTTIASGFWELTANEDLILDFALSVDTAEILSLTSNKLVFYLTDIDHSLIGDIKTEVTTTLSR